MSAIDEQLANAVARRDYKTVENLWLELLEAESLPAESLARTLGQLVDSGEGPRAVELVLALAPELLRAERYAEALPLLRAVAPAATGNEEVRSGLLTCCRRLYRRLPHLAACIDHAGLVANEDLGAAVATLDRLLSYREGDYFYHASGWGLGQIVGFDPLTPTATIDFERKPGHLVPLDTIETIFERLQPDDFRVLRKTDPDRLRAMADESPAALVRMVVAAHGRRVSTRSLRQTLTDGIVPADSWNKWWNAARGELRRDPLVAISAGSNPILTLRAEALTYEEEMSARFASLKDLHHQTELLRGYAEHRAKDADPEAFLNPAARTIAKRIASEKDPGAAFEASLLLARLQADAGEFPPPEEIIARQAHPIPLLNGLTTNAVRARALQMFHAHAADWPGLCYEVLLRGPKTLWESAVAELPESGEGATVTRLAHEILEIPKRHLELFAWVCRGLLQQRWRVGLSLLQVFESLLTQGDVLARRKAYQRGEWARFDKDEELLLIRQSIRTGDLDYFDQILAEISETEASRVLFRVRQSSVLPALLSRQLESKVIRRYPKLLVEEEHPEEAAPEYIYATPEAIARRRKEHDHVANVLIPKNSEDIARAASMGDVTDNADWRAAIQEQQVLNVKAIEMGRELQLARPIEPAMVSTDRVSIGSRVAIENTQTGERATYAILGPWDSDAEHGVIAYLAPLAKALLRHAVGDEVTFTHGHEETSYRILEIGSALEEAKP